MPFVKGNPGGPGRPRRPVEEKRLKELRKVVTSAEWLEILGVVLRLAKRGEKWAIEFLASYLIGKPAQSIDLSTPSEIRLKVVYDEPDHNDTPTA